MESEDQTNMANNDPKTMENNGPVANNETQWYQKFFVQDMCVHYQYPMQYHWPNIQNRIINIKIPETLVLPLGKSYEKPVKPPVDHEKKLKLCGI